MPDDVAVIGYDDVPSAPYADPPLTTVRQPTLRMGRELARLLLHPGESVILKTELVVRESA